MCRLDRVYTGARLFGADALDKQKIRRSFEGLCVSLERGECFPLNTSYVMARRKNSSIAQMCIPEENALGRSAGIYRTQRRGLLCDI